MLRIYKARFLVAAHVSSRVTQQMFITGCVYICIAPSGYNTA